MTYNFYHVTDTHFYSKKNFACDPWSLPQFKDNIAFRESEEILEKVLEIILEDEETSTVIFTGDMTNFGDEYSHRDMMEILGDFTTKGGNPFVVTDSHDYPWFGIFRIDENGKKIPSEHLLRKEVVPMYYPFGRDKAIAWYEKDDTTYVAEILPGLRYIALGYIFTAEDNEHGPAFTDELMSWVKEQVEKAKSEGCFIFCGTHWPIVSPSPAYELLGKGNFFVDGEKRAKEFADMGISLFLNGHTHIQYATEIVSEKGNKLYSIQTAALTGFPPKIRRITIDSDKNLIKIRTIDVDVPELNLGMPLNEYIRKGFLGSLEDIPYNMEHDVEAFANTGSITLPKEKILAHPHIVRFLGKKINNLTYGTMARFSKKYHRMKPEEYAHLKNKKVVPFVFEMVANLYSGNAPYSPETIEYRITMGVIEKVLKITDILRINLDNALSGYSLKEIVMPLLYNSGLDDDNIDIYL
jgi:hypothetical protein